MLDEQGDLVLERLELRLHGRVAHEGLDELVPEREDLVEQVLLVRVIEVELRKQVTNRLIGLRGASLLVLGQFAEEHLGLEKEQEGLLVGLVVRQRTVAVEIEPFRLIRILLLEDVEELDARSELPVDHRVPAVAHCRAVHVILP